MLSWDASVASWSVTLTTSNRTRWRWGWECLSKSSGGGEVRWMTEGIRVRPVNFWNPWGVAGIRFTVGGGCGGSTEEGVGRFWDRDGS